MLQTRTLSMAELLEWEHLRGSSPHIHKVSQEGAHLQQRTSPVDGERWQQYQSLREVVSLLFLQALFCSKGLAGDAASFLIQ